MDERVNDADLLREARERYHAGVEADRKNRERDHEDRKFYTGGENQWPAGVPAERREEGRPCESYDRLRQLVKQVTGEVRQNKPAIKVLPVDGQTDPETAKIYSAIIRHIESNSDGHRVYAKETEKAVIGGQGWWRIKADYYDDDSFEQDLCIESIPNPNAVVCDPDVWTPTKEGMTWAFVTELVSRAKFEKEYPKASLADFDTDTTHQTDWLQGDFVRVAEYWRKRESGVKKLYAFELPDGSVEKHDEAAVREMAGVKEGKVEDLIAALPVPVTIKAVRRVPIYVVESILLCGTAALGKWQAWPGKDIPLVRVVGEEIEAGDTVFRHGMIHHAKPSQMAYNFARNAMMERHGTSTKSPWLVTLKQILPFKSLWENANKKNYPFLPYEADPAAPPPSRIAPPQIDAAAYQESMVAADDMKASTGIYDAQLGAKSNETSGIAIKARDAQGDTATFVYIDNMEAAITQTGRILIDLIPHYYTEERVIRIIGEDGEIEAFEQINKVLPNGQKWNDVTTGKYDVSVSTGPAYATKRQEASDKLMQLVQAFPQLAEIGGDVVIKALDIPLGDKLAERVKRMIPPGLDKDLDEERAKEQEGQPQQPPKPSPEEMQMQAEMQMQQQKLQADQQAQQMKMQGDQQAAQQKLQLAREEAEFNAQLAREKQANEIALAWDKFEFEQKLALSKAGLEARIAEHSAHLKEGQAEHAAHLADKKASQQRPGGSVAE